MDNRQAIKAQVKGFLVPVFVGTQENGEPLNGLDAEGFELVRQGYACAKCMAVFDTYTVSCPVCHTTRDVGADIAEAPALWQQHLNERNQDEPTPRAPIDPMKAILTLGQDPNVEQIQLRGKAKVRRS